MDIKKFCKITKHLDKKYHTCYAIGTDLKSYEWEIYRSDMSWEEYMSPNNKPVLSSKTNTEEDLITFCKNNRGGILQNVRNCFK